ncbi:polysaccharide lyase family 7 protein [Mangrovicoccus algicola]|uniref:Polysaccharide lyase family 7 protein n=1 Tax=Mangrovicoccus algicola TaxID=2771008 RepID=A0A8J6YVD8_9RHOB|nr:polysaccharide lyase family 7 protein [Mangrovicoccus algicola]MBE3636773.1 polysaccharide lyase family 7 protein [Mangrovicoccus algicola]
MPWNHSIFDLNNWKVTLPVDADYFKSDGGDGNFFDDTAYEVKPPNFEGFEAEEFFYYDANQDAMIFRADVNGARTSANTNYTRSELREMNDDGSNAAWSVSQGGTLSATLKVTELAEEDDGDPARVIVGQIHGANDELCRLYYNADGDLYYANELTGSDGDERLFYFENAAGQRPNVALGETFSYIIEVVDGKLIVAIYADGQTYSAVPTDGVDPTEIIDDWNGDSFYFKAGVYQGVTHVSGHASEGSGAAEAAFFGIDISHDEGGGRDAWLGDNPGGGSGGGGTGGGSGNTIDGTSGADDISGTSGADLINAGAGADTVSGGGGNDTINGGGGYDSLKGDAGNDVLNGNAGNDTLKGGAGNDTLTGGSGSDELWGNDGDDVLVAGSGSDWLKGGAGADTYVFTDLHGTDVVADFSRPNGDVLDLSEILDGASGLGGSNAISGGYVEFVQDGADTRLYVDLDGDAGSGARVHLATLLDETAADFGLSDLIL